LGDDKEDRMARGKDAARRAVIREYDAWAAEHGHDAAKTRDGVIFFEYLRRERPDLLDFPFSGDKWKIVQRWLRTWGRVKQ
jgi:hypothetical protein